MVSTFLNLIFQYITTLIYNGFLSLYVAILVGTFIGLISKYILDKKFIFNFYPLNKRNDINTFFNYSLTGIFSTLIFWSVEISFDLIFRVEIAKYIGAIIGLCIGYTIKYNMDKKFVFKQPEAK
jgi:putative flippase GtrA